MVQKNYKDLHYRGTLIHIRTTFSKRFNETVLFFFGTATHSGIIETLAQEIY